MKKKYLATLLFVFLAFWTIPLGAAQEKRLLIADATQEPASLDPHMHYSTQVTGMLRQIYDTLFDRDPDGKVLPGLVESWENMDPVTWEFNLRKGAKFQNGDEVTAKDVRFSIERIINPETRSPQIRDLRTIDHVSVLDTYKIRIMTKGPDPILPSRFVFMGNILPEEAFKKAGPVNFFNNPIGAGPFKFSKWEKNKELVLSGNREYYRHEPKIKEIVFKFVPDEEKRVQMLLSGDLHIVTNIMPQRALILKKGAKTKLLKKSALQFYDVFLDTVNSSILAQKKVRQALNYGTDSNKLIRYVHKGNGKRLATFTMPEEFGFNPALTPYPFDLDKAKSLLREAGYPGGFKLKMLSMDHLFPLSIALKNDWKKLGIEVDIEVRPREEAILKGLIKKEIPFDIFVSDPTDPLFDASYQMTIHLDPHHPICRFQNEKVSQLLYDSQVSMEPTKRSELLKKIQETILEEAPIVFLYQSISIYGVSSDLVNFVPYTDTMLRLNDVEFKK